MKTLDEIAIEQQTDRATVFTRTWGKPHAYAPHYERCFAALRDQPIKLLEIGVGGGEGIRMWLEYFGMAEVFGVDKQHDNNEWDTPGSSPTPRYTFVTGDQSSDTFWQCFMADYGRDWDIIIDDGGHYANQVITTFNNLWPVVKPGGFYAVEDLGVAYGDGSFTPAPWQNHMTWLKDKLDAMNTSGGIDSIYFARELAVLRKAF